MAESNRAKAERYSRGEFTNSELKIMLGGMLADQLIDVATFGRLSKLKGKAVQKVVWPIVRGAGRALGVAAPKVGRAIIPPIAGPAALAYGMYETGRAAADQGRRDAEQGFQIPIPLWNPILGDMPTIGMEDIQRGLGAGRSEFDRLMTEGPRPLRRTRRASSFNKAISAGMKAVRSSKFMGKKGVISNSKRAFATVTKTVSGMKKGRKRPTKGVRGAIARAARRYI